MKLYKQIIIALALIYITLLVSDKMYCFLLNNNLYIKQTYIQKRKIDADIIILGNCVPKKLINPSITEKITRLKTYNLAETHANISENFLSYYIYLKTNKAPQKLFIYTTPETFDPTLNKFSSYRFATLLNDTEVKKTVINNDPNYYKWSFVPFIKYRYYNSPIHFNALQGAKHYFTKRKKTRSENGYLTLNENYNFKSSYPFGYKFVWDKLQEKNLLELILFAQKQGTKVILFESPVFISDLKEMPNRIKIIQKIKSLAIRTDVKFIQFDLSNLSKKNFLNNVTLKGKEKLKFNVEFAKIIKNK